MKKFIVGILAILYMSSSTGATLHMHYCMGKLVDMALWHGKVKKCGNCASKKITTLCSKKCCKDEHKTIKLEKDQKTAEAFQLIQLACVATTVNYIELPQEKIMAIAQQYPVSHAPPRSSKVHPYIFNCTFRI